MSVQFRLDGFDELRAALRALPKELAGEGSQIVVSAGEEAKREITDDYPAGVTGNLKEGMGVKARSIGEYGAGVTVINRAQHAWLFENGSQARHYYTKNGKKHLTGKMPPGHVFIPVMMRKRREMYLKLADLLMRHGLVVSGEA